MHFTIITAKMRLVLPSNSSMTYFPNNTLSEFTVKLPQRLDLSKGKWEVGLEEISFYKSWYNVKDASIAYYNRKDELMKKVEFPDGYFETPKSFIKHLNDTAEQQMSKHFQFFYDEKTRRCKVITKFYRYYKVVMSPSLANIIGKLPQVSKRIIDKDAAVYRVFNIKTTLRLEPIFNIMVYSNITSENIVGDTESPLLRAVSVDQDYWKMQSTNFTRVQYIPVSKNQIDSITIYIYTDYGEKVPFEDGRVICTLDLRRVTPTYDY